MRVEISISLKKSVLDPQGQAVQEAISRSGFEGVSNCRIGKTITLDLADMPHAQADDQIKKMCDAILVNPIIETYTYKIMETA